MVKATYIEHITSGNAHAYIKSQFDRYDVSQLAAEKALDAWEKSVRPAMPRRPCPRTEECVSTDLCALADFDGIYYGKEYLTFLKGDTIVKLLKLGEIYIHQCAESSFHFLIDNWKCIF